MKTKWLPYLVIFIASILNTIYLNYVQTTLQEITKNKGLDIINYLSLMMSLLYVPIIWIVLSATAHLICNGVLEVELKKSVFKKFLLFNGYGFIAYIIAYALSIYYVVGAFDGYSNTQNIVDFLTENPTLEKIEVIQTMALFITLIWILRSIKINYNTSYINSFLIISIPGLSYYGLTYLFQYLF